MRDNLPGIASFTDTITKLLRADDTRHGERNFQRHLANADRPHAGRSVDDPVQSALDFFDQVRFAHTGLSHDGIRGIV